MVLWHFCGRVFSDLQADIIPYACSRLSLSIEFSIKAIAAIVLQNSSLLTKID